MEKRKRFIALMGIGILLVGTAVVFKLLPADADIQPHTAEFFPVQDPATGMWGFIDNQGNPVTAMVFDWAGDFRQGRGLVEVKGAMGYIDADYDETGEWVIAPRFELLHDSDIPVWGFFDGRALARGESGKWGYIDTSGAWVIEPRFIESEDYPGTPSGDFSEGLAWFQVVEMDERYVMRNEEIVKNEAGERLKEDYPRRLMGFIDREGEVVIEARYDMVQDFGEGLAGVRIKSHGQWGFIDKDGQRKISPKYDGVGRFSEGLCAVRKGELWGFIDAKGQWVIEPTYREAKQFLEGLAPVREGKKWGYIDKDGQWAIEPKYDDFEDYAHPGDPRPFENGLARVTLNGERIYIDIQGEQVWPKQ